MLCVLTSCLLIYAEPTTSFYFLISSMSFLSKPSLNKLLYDIIVLISKCRYAKRSRGVTYP